MNLTQTLIEMNKPGVWAFVNDTDRIIYLSYSKNIQSTISRNIKEVMDNSHSCKRLIKDKSKLNLVVLEYNCEKAKLNYWLDHYRNDGYSLYRNRNGEVTYRLQVKIVAEYLIHVILRNLHGNSVVVGVFDSMEEANTFIQTHYPDKIYNIVYSDNKLTQHYLKRKASTV